MSTSPDLSAKALASPEAKQAAIDIVNRTGANTFDLAEIEERIQQAIDAKQEQRQPSEKDIADLKASGFKFEPTDDGSACYPSKHGSWNEPKLRLVLDWRKYLQPSATAPDMEQIICHAGNEAATWYWKQQREKTGSVTVEQACIRASRETAAQAREPLVKALERAEQGFLAIARHPWPYSDISPGIEARACRAALTGTSEK